LSPFSLSFLSRERDLFDRSLPEREDFEPVRRFSLLSPLVYRKQSMSMNYFIVITITENIYKNMKIREESEHHKQLFQIETLFLNIPFSLAISVPLGTFPSVTPLSVSIPRTTSSLSMSSLISLPLSVPASRSPSFLLGFGRSRSRSRPRSSPVVSVSI